MKNLFILLAACLMAVGAKAQNMDFLAMMAIILLIIAYVLLVRVYIAYLMAKNRHRDPIGWVLLSLFFSPLLAWIILLIVGDDENWRRQQDMIDMLNQREGQRYRSSSYEDMTH